MLVLMINVKQYAVELFAKRKRNNSKTLKIKHCGITVLNYHVWIKDDNVAIMLMEWI